VYFRGQLQNRCKHSKVLSTLPVDEMLRRWHEQGPHLRYQYRAFLTQLDYTECSWWKHKLQRTEALKP